MTTQHDAPTAPDPLGKLVEEFRPPRGNAFAARFFAVALAGFGVFSLVRSFIRQDPNSGEWEIALTNDSGVLNIVFALLVGIGCLVGAPYLWRFGRKLSMLRVQIREHGLRQYVGDAVETVAWNDVVRIKEAYHVSRTPDGTTSSLDYSLECSGERSLKFDKDLVGKIKQFGKRLQDVAEASSIVWESNRHKS